MANIAEKILNFAKSQGISQKYICDQLDQITQVRTLVVQKCICDTDEDAAEIKIFAVFSFSQIEKPPASAHTVAIAQGFCFFSVFELQYV